MKSELKVISIIVITLSFIFLPGCKKLVDVTPPKNTINGQNVFNSDATAIAVLTGLYTQISSTQYTAIGLGLPSLSRFCGLSADELNLWNGIANSNNTLSNMQSFYYTNSLYSNSTGGAGYEFYGNFYNYIFTCNFAIEQLTKSQALTPAIKQQLLGEAKFIRALSYFYLVNLYGDVPLALTSDYEKNRLLANASKPDVYLQIISDLKDAQNLLSTNFLDATLLKTSVERVRPTKWAAIALLARVYLYTQDWLGAENEAALVINNASLLSLVALNNVFLKNSNEAIWQLQPVYIGWNTEDARLFIFPTSAGPTVSNPVYLSSFLLSAFEPNDNRKTSWINSVTAGGITYNYPYKYKSATNGAPVTEYLMVLRLAEQYLIRAEARVQQNKISEAQADLNTIRTRAGLPNTSASDKASLLSAILHERQVELFTELGHRWLDLKRTGNVDAIMSAITPLKGGTWETTDKLYPLSFSDLQMDPNLTQNSGY